MRSKERKVLPKHGWGLDRMPAGNILMPYRLLQEHVVRYIFASRYVRGKTVLDIACGSGYGGSYLLSKGARTVVGGDSSEEAIRQAIQYYKKDNLEFILLDATKMPIVENTFEIVVSFETIEHIPNYEEFLSECQRIMRHDGIFICSTPNVIIPGTEKSVNPFHVNEFNVKQLEDTLHKYFSKVELFGEGCQNDNKITVKQKIANIIKNRLLWFPFIGNLNRLVTKFILKDYRLLTLTEVEDYDTLWNEKNKPLPINQCTSKPGNIIAIAYK